MNWILIPNDAGTSTHSLSAFFTEKDKDAYSPGIEVEDNFKSRTVICCNGNKISTSGWCFRTGKNFLASFIYYWCIWPLCLPNGRSRSCCKSSKAQYCVNDKGCWVHSIAFDAVSNHGDSIFDVGFGVCVGDSVKNFYLLPIPFWEVHTEKLYFTVVQDLPSAMYGGFRRDKLIFIAKYGACNMTGRLQEAVTPFQTVMSSQIIPHRVWCAAARSHYSSCDDRLLEGVFPCTTCQNDSIPPKTVQPPARDGFYRPWSFQNTVALTWLGYSLACGLSRGSQWFSCIQAARTCS